MVANGKLHSLQKTIFFSWWCFGTVFALPGFRVLPKGWVVPISVILLTAIYLEGLVANRP